jgi:hypothetical protein
MNKPVIPDPKPAKTTRSAASQKPSAASMDAGNLVSMDLTRVLQSGARRFSSYLGARLQIANMAGSGPPTSSVRQEIAAPVGDKGASTVLVREDTVDYWISVIKEDYAKTVAAFIKTGRDLIAAKGRLGHGQFASLFDGDRLGFSQRTAELFMQIAEHPFLSNPNNYSILPVTLTALNVLSRLPETELAKARDTKKLNPDMTIVQARSLSTTEASPAKEGNVSDEAALCDRSLKGIGRQIENAKEWSSRTRKHFCVEVTRMLDALK